MRNCFSPLGSLTPFRSLMKWQTIKHYTCTCVRLRVYVSTCAVKTNTYMWNLISDVLLILIFKISYRCHTFPEINFTHTPRLYKRVSVCPSICVGPSVMLSLFGLLGATYAVYTALFTNWQQPETLFILKLYYSTSIDEWHSLTALTTSQKFTPQRKWDWRKWLPLRLKLNKVNNASLWLKEWG